MITDLVAIVVNLRVREALVLLTDGDLFPICLATLVVHVGQGDAMEECFLLDVLNILADGHALETAESQVSMSLITGFCRMYIVTHWNTLEW